MVASTCSRTPSSDGSGSSPGAATGMSWSSTGGNSPKRSRSRVTSGDTASMTGFSSLAPREERRSCPASFHESRAADDWGDPTTELPETATAAAVAAAVSLRERWLKTSISSITVLTVSSKSSGDRACKAAATSARMTCTLERCACQRFRRRSAIASSIIAALLGETALFRSEAPPEGTDDDEGGTKNSVLTRFTTSLLMSMRQYCGRRSDTWLPEEDLDFLPGCALGTS
mmetsp:Transcript_15811/g.46534  ORF Transcript_15811/g.46534 Transcript_15811/m.46534 type:complete len:230 (-) Transcript_15811:3339-4028(-)